jgi:hypothetical protein
MPFKPNYNQQRADRERAKQKKQQEKLRKREEDAARRKAARGEPLTHANGGDPDADKPELQ